MCSAMSLPDVPPVVLGTGPRCVRRMLGLVVAGAPRVAVLALLLAATLTVGGPTVTAQDSPRVTGPEATLPGKREEIAPFLATLDDKQARATLAKVLEERTKPAETETLDFFPAAKRGTSIIATRLNALAAAVQDVGRAPSVFWRWLTSDGTEPGAPVRALLSALAILSVCWAAQAGAAWALRRTFARHGSAWVGTTLLLRWSAFLGGLALTHALLPGAGSPAHQTALAILLAFAGAWIASGAVTILLPAMHGSYHSPSVGTAWMGRLEVAFGVFFGCVFGLSLLREAGVPDDARLLIALPIWLAVGAFVLMALPGSHRPIAANDPIGVAAGLDPVERFLALRGSALVKVSGVALLVLAGVDAVIRGPEGLWRGIYSFALLALLVAALGLTRLPPSPEQKGHSLSRSIGQEALRSAIRIGALIVFVFALAAVWRVDPLETANAQVGEHFAWGIVAAASTLVISYWLWQLIRSVLDQSALGPPVAVVRGEEGEQAIATRLQTVGPVLRNFLFVALVCVGTLVCLASLGVNITPLLAGMGVIGIALGFGSQTLVRDIISGAFFLAEDAFRIGEYIQVGNTRGTVEGIAIRSVRLRHHRGPVHTLPFGEIKQLTNYSRDWIIMKLEFLLAFGTDLRKVKRLVKIVGEQLRDDPDLGPALLEPLKSQGVRRMEQTGLVVGIKFMARPGSEVYLLRREIYQRLLDTFEQNGVEFARPQILVANPTGAEGAEIPADAGAAAHAQISGPKRA